MVTIQTPIPTWRDDASPSEIQTEVRKALSDMTASLNTLLNANPGSGSLLGTFPTSSSGSIFKTTTNANGTAVQFSDGTMIQSATQTLLTSTPQTVTLPIPFTSTAYSAVAIVNATSANIFVQQDGVKTSSAFILYLTIIAGATGSAPVDWIAFGRWKT